MAHPRFLQEALELAMEREVLCTDSPGDMLDKLQKVRAAGGTVLNVAEPARLGELTQPVQAATLRQDQHPRPRFRVSWGGGDSGHLV